MFRRSGGCSRSIPKRGRTSLTKESTTLPRSTAKISQVGLSDSTRVTSCSSKKHVRPTPIYSALSDRSISTLASVFGRRFLGRVGCLERDAFQGNDSIRKLLG